MHSDIWLPLLAALITGSLIGLEREVQSHPAGLRTHALVCLTCAALMVAATHQAYWDLFLVTGGEVVADPTRMAHGILTGVGFLCAGAIFRDGFTVQGLTTAASLWATSAIGILYGVGMYELGIVATVGTGLILVVFKILYARLPRRVLADLTVKAHPDGPLDEAALRGLLQALKLKVDWLGRGLIEDGRFALFRMKLVSAGALDTASLAARLRDAGAVEFEVAPRGD